MNTTVLLTKAYLFLNNNAAREILNLKVILIA